MARLVFSRSLHLCLIVLLATSAVLSRQDRKPYPKTRTDNVTETIHGVKITDPYRWLEDKDSAETRAWLKEQIEYTDSLLSAAPGRDSIHRHFEQLIKVDTISVPFVRGDRYFITKRRADQNQSVIYVRQGLNGKDEALIDSNTLSPDQTTTANIMGISRDGKLLAYGIRKGVRMRSQYRSSTSIHERTFPIGSPKDVTGVSRSRRTEAVSITRSSRWRARVSTITRWGPIQPGMKRYSARDTVRVKSSRRCFPKTDVT